MKISLSDEEFLKFYCASAEVIFDNGNTKNEGVFIKNTNHVFCYTSKEYQARLNPNGTILVNDILNKKKTKITQDKNIEKFREEAEAQDQLIMNTRETLLYLYVDVYNQLGIIRKCPIVNPSTDNVVGVLGYVHPFMLPNMLDIIYQINGVTHEKPNKLDSSLCYQLTPRQHMVLFLCLYKYSYTEVAMILTNLGHKISSGRVNEHLENLKYIFAVKSKEELIEKAIRLKYHLFIPRKFLKIGSFALKDTISISDT